jgi:nitrite reductase (NADH) large subunit
MAAHVDSYADEWAGVLNDPDKLSRFVSFVNAPAVPDPTITFDDDSGRKIPVLLGMPTSPQQQNLEPAR